MSLRKKLRGFYISCQQELFPQVEQHYGLLPRRYRTLLYVFEMVEVENFLPRPVLRAPGRPQAHRASLARSFLAKMVLNIPTTAGLHERLLSEKMLRSLCGWSRSCDVPSASTFSRAFQEFAATELPSRLHEARIQKSCQERLIGHISRDSTAIEAREKAVPKKKKPAPVARKRGRPKKGEERPKAPKRLVRQRTMTLEEMLDDLPKECTVSCKRNAKGVTQSWTGYKLHMDVADGGIPISGLVTSASLHDSQAALPLATLTAQRVDHCYDLMDSAYDAKAIHAHSRASGQVPIIDSNPRTRTAAHRREKKAQRTAGFTPPERVRYRERSTVERAFGRLKDEFGARHVRVRGYQKVMCHLMFAIVVLTVDQLLRLIQ